MGAVNYNMTKIKILTAYKHIETKYNLNLEDLEKQKKLNIDLVFEREEFKTQRDQLKKKLDTLSASLQKAEQIKRDYGMQVKMDVQEKYDDEITRLKQEIERLKKESFKEGYVSRLNEQLSIKTKQVEYREEIIEEWKDKYENLKDSLEERVKGAEEENYRNLKQASREIKSWRKEVNFLRSVVKGLLKK